MSTKYAVKVMCLLRRKPGLSLEEFIEYYENKHVPLILRILPYQADYRRNYVQPGSEIATMDGRPADYDVITEASFATQEDFDKFCVEAAKPQIREIIVADEAKFIDRDNLRFFVVDEFNSVISDKRASVATVL
ncbi:EthD domain-containing protein [Rhizorhabdus argentea]|uniref:EthD domain-containing protein n=1 Tax=Rhizorhabdus argentea TaxID=1387174 RepID=UPI0030EBDA97